ncbi:glycosyltransferase family 25 protein [Methylobacterium sp.]|uniref:glycosyltransferase family 25 protein n=1 Tax=Methylobacterium sp. TaxID=409 RepID=UPI0015C82833|nr:glycosyltransferase family 25 protein [Methylobacterium sp.]
MIDADRNVPVHIINLDRDAERLKTFMHRNDFLQVVRPDAVEGRNLDRDELARTGMIHRDLRYTNPALGNAHSHIGLWTKAADEDVCVTIAEDDAIFSRDFHAGARTILDALPSDWDVVLWGVNFDAFLWLEVVEGVRCKLQFEQDDLRARVAEFRDRAGLNVPLRLRHSFGVMAYTVSPLGARNLMKICLPLSNQLIEFPGYGVVIENNTIDAAMNAAYPSLKAFVCIPPLAISENRHESSTIQGEK